MIVSDITTQGWNKLIASGNANYPSVPILFCILGKTSPAQNSWWPWGHGARKYSSVSFK